MNKPEILKQINPEATRKQMRYALMALFGLNFEKISKKLGCSKVHINCVVNGKSRSFIYQEKFAEMFGLARKELFD